MRLGKLMGAVSTFALCLSLASPVFAADTQPPVSGDALNTNTPQLDYLLNNAHASLTAIAPLDIGGGQKLDGVAFDIGGKKSTGYLTPNGQYFIIGVAIDSSGHNVTMEALSREEAKLASALKQAGALVKQSDQQALGLTGSASDTLPVAGDGDVAGAQPLKTPVIPTASATPLLVKEAAATPTPAPVQAKEDPRWATSKFTAAELSKDLDGTAFFRVGRHDSPNVVLVANPKCPFCHLAWQQLKPYIDSGKISVSVVLVDILPTSERNIRTIGNLPDARSVVMLLANPAIDKAWIDGQGSSDDAAIVETTRVGSREWNDAYSYLTSNDQFRDKYQPLFAADEKSGVPILVYTNKDGKAYGREGVSTPEDMKSFLGGIL